MYKKIKKKLPYFHKVSATEKNILIHKTNDIFPDRASEYTLVLLLLGTSLKYKIKLFGDHILEQSI